MKAVVLALSAAILIGCASTRAAVPPPSESAGEYREIQGEIQKQQTDLAITGEKLKEGTKGIVEGITDAGFYGKMLSVCPLFSFMGAAVPGIKELGIVVKDHVRFSGFFRAPVPFLLRPLPSGGLVSLPCGLCGK